MPSPSEKDPARPGSAWPVDTSNRRPERRRYGTQSAFASGASATSPRTDSDKQGETQQQGGSYGGNTGGRASGSQSYGYERSNAAPGAQSSPALSQEVYGAHGVGAAADPQRPTGQQDEPTPERQHQRRHTDWRGREEPAARTEPTAGGHTQHNPFDPDYRQWRDEQMRQLDRDYAQWRQERYEQFSQEFSRWRSQKSHAAAQPRNADSGADSLVHASALSPAPPDPALRPESPVGANERTEKPAVRNLDRPSSGGLLSSLLGGHTDRKSDRTK